MSERSERASIRSVQWKSAIYIYMYVCIVFSIRSCARLRITLTRRVTNSTFHAGGVDLTNAADSRIAHTPRKKRKQIKEKVQMGEGSRT